MEAIHLFWVAVKELSKEVIELSSLEATHVWHLEQLEGGLWAAACSERFAKARGSGTPEDSSKNTPEPKQPPTNRDNQESRKKKKKKKKKKVGTWDIP